MAIAQESLHRTSAPFRSHPPHPQVFGALHGHAGAGCAAEFADACGQVSGQSHMAPWQYDGSRAKTHGIRNSASKGPASHQTDPLRLTYVDNSHRPTSPPSCTAVVPYLSEAVHSFVTGHPNSFLVGHGCQCKPRWRGAQQRKSLRTAPRCFARRTRHSRVLSVLPLLDHRAVLGSRIPRYPTRNES